MPREDYPELWKNDDIVVRLRRTADPEVTWDDVTIDDLNDAADEIERLRAAIGKRDRELVGIRSDAMQLMMTDECDSTTIKTFLRRVVEADAYLDC